MIHIFPKKCWIFIAFLVTCVVGILFSDNLLRMHFVKFWKSSGDICQSLWSEFLEKFGDDEYKLLVVGTTILLTGLYWAVGLIFVFMDFFNWPKWTRKYKVQPGTNEPVDTKRLLATIKQVLFNQIIVAIPFTMIYTWFYLKFWRNKDNNVYELPTFTKALTDFLFFIIIEEIGFYYSHRLLHHPLLYKRVHKMHHQWTSPIAITAIYCHPLEHILSNMIPVSMGPSIMSSHVVVAFVWYTLAIINTLTVHSGYHFPGMISPESHDFHHLKFTENYGVLGILDYIHGTDRLFRSSGYERRNVISWSLKPVSSLYPVNLVNNNRLESHKTDNNESCSKNS